MTVCCAAGRTAVPRARRAPGAGLVASDVFTPDSSSQPSELGVRRPARGRGGGWGSGQAGHTAREMRSGRLPPGLLQLITNPRDSRNRGSIRHLRRWRSQRKLYGLPNSFHESLCVANVHWTTDYVCARPDASYLIFTHLHNHPKRQVLSVSPLHR